MKTYAYPHTIDNGAGGEHLTFLRRVPGARGAIQRLEGSLVGFRDFAPLEVPELGVVPAYRATVFHGDRPPSVRTVVEPWQLSTL